MDFGLGRLEEVSSKEYMFKVFVLDLMISFILVVFHDGLEL